MRKPALIIIFLCTAGLFTTLLLLRMFGTFSPVAETPEIFSIAREEVGNVLEKVPAFFSRNRTEGSSANPHDEPLLSKGSIFSADELHTCGSGDFISRPPELLCRQPRELSENIRDYIKTLAIRDNDFYDVFDESEILRLFKPRPWNTKPLIRFQSLDNHLKLLAQYQGISSIVNVQRFQSSDAEWTAFFAFFADRGRKTEDMKDDAHLNYLPLAISKMFELNARSPIDLESFNTTFDFVKQTLTSKEFNDHQGLDYFSIVSRADGMELLLNRSAAVINGTLSAGGDVGLPEAALRPALLSYSSIPSINPCQIVMGGSAIARLRLNRHFPRGPLPSYQYALGSLAYLMDMRRYNFWLASQWNETLRNQALAVKELSGQYSPSALMGSVMDEGLPACARQQHEGCRIEYDQYHADLYPYTILRSKFGLILPHEHYYASPRLMDVIAAGLIPVILFREILAFGLPGQCHVPWREMAIFISESEFIANPRKAIENHVLSLTKMQAEKMLRLLEYYRPDILHTMDDTRVPQGRLIELTLKCLPEAYLAEKHRMSKASLRCDFEDFTSAPAFSLYKDEDDEPAWNTAWFAPITSMHVPA